jgi:hypothetical protein
MKLSQKIKHIKRHRKNKRIAKYADDIHFAAAECFLSGDKNIFIISQRLYSIMESRRHYVPKNIKSSALNCDNEIITVPRDITEFYNSNELDYIEEWCGIPNLHKQPSEETIQELNNIPLGQFVNPELYIHIDKPIAPDITTLNGVRI